MQKIVDVQVFDWSRGKVAGIQGRGMVSLLSQSRQVSSGSGPKSRPRCIWPTLQQSNASRYLSRRVWGR